MWRRSGAVIGIDRFGESAPAEKLFALFGITAESVAQAVRGLVKRRGPADEHDADPQIIRSTN